MGARIPPCDGHSGDVAEEGNFHNPMFENGDVRAMDAALPPPSHGDGSDGSEGGGDGDGNDDGDGSGGGDTDKPVRSRTRIAKIALFVGLALEVAVTLWAFQEAVSAGAFDPVVECTNDGVFSKLYVSSVVVDVCDGPIEAEAFYNFTASQSATVSLWEEHVVCDDLDTAPTGDDSFEERCSCHDEVVTTTPCSWVPLSGPADDMCFAESMETYDDGEVAGPTPTSFGQECWASNPSGTAELTAAALVVALSGQLLEALVGFKYWKDTEKRAAAFTLAVSVFEALGVVAVSSVLLSLPGFYGASVDTSERILPFFWLAWATIPIVVVGALVETTAVVSNRVAGRLPYLRLFGNALVWLGAALLEVVVTSYVIYTAAGIQIFEDLVREAIGLYVLEAAGLVAMWAAHGLWERAKVLSASVKIFGGPLRKGATTFFK